MGAEVTSLNKYAGASKTDSGTKIVKSGEDMDKNSFLKILSAELSNLDPSKDSDSTAYVSQLAQFASMEQMSNLNTTMSTSAYQSYVGKGVTVKETDAKGAPYTGIVQGVTVTSKGATLSVTVNENGKNVIKQFDAADVVSTVAVQDYSIPPLTSLNGNMSFLLASSFINQNVEVDDKDASGNNIKGTVKGTYKENGNIMVRMQLTTGETKEYSYDKIIKVGNFEETSNTSNA